MPEVTQQIAVRDKSETQSVLLKHHVLGYAT